MKHSGAIAERRTAKRAYKSGGIDHKMHAKGHTEKGLSVWLFFPYFNGEKGYFKKKLRIHRF